MMPFITVEQARTVVAVAELRSFAKAAKRLNKVHSAVVYSLKTLEEALGVELFDRSGYRTELTTLGRRVVEHCEKMLRSADDIAALCLAVRAGDSANLTIVFDGLLPAPQILKAVRVVTGRYPATRISLFSEFLGEVEGRYERENADLMITIVPSRAPAEHQTPLRPLSSSLVASVDHPLARLRQPTLSDLRDHTFLTVRGSDERLNMSTSVLDEAAIFRLSDFHTKRLALLAGMGYGWMPDHLVAADLKRRRLAVIKWGEQKGRHVFRPILVRRGLTNTVSALIDALSSQSL